MTQTNPFARDYQEPARTTAPGQIDEFELMRRRLKARGAVSADERQRELQRQFASMGNMPSGAAIRAQQQTATAAERATNEALQDVNIAQADTLRQEREALAGRNLARQTLAQELGSRETVAREQIASTEKISQDQLAWAERERTLIEQGMDARQARELAQSKDMFDIEIELKKRGQSFLEDSTNREFDLNKSISALNAVNLLTQTGFGREEVAGIFQTLGLPHAEFLSEYFINKRLPSDVRISRGQMPGIANQWTPMGGPDQQGQPRMVSQGGQSGVVYPNGIFSPFEYKSSFSTFADREAKEIARREDMYLTGQPPAQPVPRRQPQTRRPLLARTPFAAAAERRRRGLR